MPDISTEENLKYWLALLRCQGIGPATFNALLHHFAEPEGVFKSSQKQLENCQLNEKCIKSILQPDWQGVEMDLEWAVADHHYILRSTDRNYPPLLKECSNAPAVLFVMGSVEALSEPQIAMIGSRNPSTGGKQTATEFARHLSASGLGIT
ncbi:MAG: DNA-processing protein DprA, partial [Gammaproteobacteria bacterium]|nr:DNA-processing protein DprA [Gammaproteobacteria bacterium]